MKFVIKQEKDISILDKVDLKPPFSITHEYMTSLAYVIEDSLKIQYNYMVKVKYKKKKFSMSITRKYLGSDGIYASQTAHLDVSDLHKLSGDLAYDSYKIATAFFEASSVESNE